jgi:hypothetical protein
MIDLIIYLNETVMQICVAWSRSQDTDEVAVMTGMSPEYIGEEIARLKRLGILVDNGQLDEHVDRYIQQTVANKIRSERAG